MELVELNMFLFYFTVNVTNKKMLHFIQLVGFFISLKIMLLDKQVLGFCLKVILGMFYRLG